jgi:hypothetical protein
MLEHEDGTLYALTPTGVFYIEQLHRNRPALIAHRLALRQRLAELRRAEEAVRGQKEDLERT